MRKAFCWVALSGNFGLWFLWHILHLIISIWYFTESIANTLESHIISSGLLKRYKYLDVGKVRYLALVVDSEEARDTFKVIELLRWLAAIGINKVCLYDTEGVLKKSKEFVVENLKNAKLLEEAAKIDPLLDKQHMTLEFTSISDGKEAVSKAANLLLLKYYMNGAQKDCDFAESHMAEALRDAGYGGPDPDLLLVYGPARCHLGFPAWRIRYTEIVHMGKLRSMKYGSLLKAIYRFTAVRQNYGS